SASKTTVAPYSLRGRFLPTVATPRTWEEFDDPGSVEHVRFEEVLDRLEDLGDLLEPLATSAGDKDAASVQDPEQADAPQDRLTTYRSMRDAKKTPEPVPDRHGDSGDELTFVIQEHHARSLHWDFRLEHDGVLVSWALPKGPPTDPGKNHLAVQTEDHPLEYGSFEGTIPKGEYGAGDVEIWDAGTIEVEKWQEGKEIIAVLHGREDGGLGGVRRFALFNTGDHGPNKEPEKNWMIHLMEDAAKKEALPADLSPMLASIGDIGSLRREAEDWAFEMKWDGIRALARVAPGDGERTGSIELTSRNGHDMTNTYPELHELVEC